MDLLLTVFSDTYDLRIDMFFMALTSMVLALGTLVLHFRLKLGQLWVWLKKYPMLYIFTALIVANWLWFWVSLIGSVPPAISVAGIVILALGVVDFLLRAYRHKPFVPRDFAMSVNINQIAAMLSPIAIFVLLGIAGVTAAGFVWFLQTVPTSGWPVLLRVTSGIVSAVILAGILLMRLPHNPLRHLAVLCGADFDSFRTNTHGSYDRNGFVIAFCEQIAAPVMTMPKGYCCQEIERICEKYNKLALDSSEVQKPLRERPHIVFIMSESFSDPTAFGTEWNEDPIPFIRSVMSGPAGWRALCPGYGGGTAHSECEALTGFSTGLCGDNSPYENCIAKRKTFPSFVRLLLESGYHTAALHPYNDTMYARPKAYNAMGFKDFITQKDMRHQFKPDNSPYISDKAAYNEVMDLLTQSKAPQFIHLVTMQNHGGYTSGRFNNQIKVKENRKKAARSLETYAQGLRYTDEATKEFLSQLETLDRNAVVLFWGDHLPFAYPESAVAPHRLGQYLTPAFCWFANHKPHINKAIMSPMFFARLLGKVIGLPPRGFDRLLDELGECIQGIHMDFLVDKNGNLLDGEPDELSAELLRDFELIQYDLFEGGRWSEELGFFTAKTYSPGKSSSS